MLVVYRPPEVCSQSVPECDAVRSILGRFSKSVPHAGRPVRSATRVDKESFMTRRTIFAAFCAIVSLTVCACSGNRLASPAGGVVPALRPAISLEQSQGGVVPAKRHKISGTYKGKVTVSANGQKQSGTIKVVIMQKKKDVSGPVYITLAGDTKKYSFSGKITSSKKKKPCFPLALKAEAATQALSERCSKARRRC